MIYVEPFAGAAAVWLATLRPGLVPPTAWIGGKRRLAERILWTLGVGPGSRPPAVLNDGSWWGWMWPLLLGPRGPEVCARLRSWEGEEARALWFRLRDAGPQEDPVEHAASLLWLQARAASGVPVWWEQDDLRQRAHVDDVTSAASQSGHNLVQWTATRIDGAGQRDAAPACAKGYIGGPAGPARLLAFGGTGSVADAGHKQLRSTAGRAGGIVHPESVARRIEAIRADACGVSVEVHAQDAEDFAEKWAPRLRAAAVVYMDPPYIGCAGYPMACSRESVLRQAETWARQGARVAVSEAVSLAGDLGSGWRSVSLVGGRKQEWLTTWGCAERGHLGPLFRDVEAST